MIRPTEYHEDAFNKFIKEYSEKNNLSEEIVLYNIKYYNVVPKDFPVIEVYFNNGEVYTVNRVNEIDIRWAEGNDIYPQQSGYNR